MDVSLRISDVYMIKNNVPVDILWERLVRDAEVASSNLVATTGWKPWKHWVCGTYPVFFCVWKKRRVNKIPTGFRHMSVMGKFYRPTGSIGNAVLDGGLFLLKYPGVNRIIYEHSIWFICIIEKCFKCFKFFLNIYFA